MEITKGTAGVSSWARDRNYIVSKLSFCFTFFFRGERIHWSYLSRTSPRHLWSQWLACRRPNLHAVLRENRRTEIQPGDFLREGVFFHQKKRGQQFFCVLGWFLVGLQKLIWKLMEDGITYFGFCLFFRQSNKNTSGIKQHPETLVDGFVIGLLLNLKNQPPIN